MPIPNSLRKLAEEKEIKNVSPKNNSKRNREQVGGPITALVYCPGGAYRNSKESRRRKGEGVKRLSFSFFQRISKALLWLFVLQWSPLEI